MKIYKNMNSEVEINFTTFPDGQILPTLVTDIFSSDTIQIVHSIPHFEDLQKLIVVTKLLQKYTKNIYLKLGYVIGYRSDRPFNDKQICYFKDVSAHIINSLNYVNVTILDQHSDVNSAVIDNCINIKPYEYIESAIGLIDYSESFEIAKRELILISPDFGAFKKVNSVAEINERKMICFTKIRNEMGEIKFDIVNNTKTLDKNANYLIIDDICDGGRTFINILDFLIEQGIPHKQLNLYVTHGIFSNGIDVFNNKLNKIFTTNTITDIHTKHDLLTVFDFYED